MSVTYTGQPLTRIIDEVRLLLGDTIEEKAQVQDEEIDYALDKDNNSPHRAAARLADALSAKFAKEASVRTGSITTGYGQLARHFSELAMRLRRAVAPTAFISNLTDKGLHDSQKIDTSIIQPSIKRGMDSINRSTTSSTSKTSDS